MNGEVSAERAVLKLMNGKGQPSERNLQNKQQIVQGHFLPGYTAASLLWPIPAFSAYSMRL